MADRKQFRGTKPTDPEFLNGPSYGPYESGRSTSL